MAIRSGRGSRQAIGMEIEGVEELERTLGDVSPRSAHNIMRNTMTDAARDVRDDMKRRAPKDEGTLRKAIKAKRDRGKPGKISASVYITHGKGAKHDAFHWHFIEHGTRGYSVGERRVDAVGQSHGKVTVNIPARPAQPFIKPAVESFRQRAARVMRENFGKRYEKEMARLAKKAKR